MEKSVRVPDSVMLIDKTRRLPVVDGYHHGLSTVTFHAVSFKKRKLIESLWRWLVSSGLRLYRPTC